MIKPHPLPQVNEFFTGFPVALIKHLRLVLEATSPSDTFTCYCNLLEWLTTYLANLGNSVYKDRPSEQVDERLELHLRSTSSPISFGSAVGGLRALSQSGVDFAARLPELALILSERSLPLAIARMVKAFQVIRKAREEYEVPPSRLEQYIRDSNINEKSLGKCSLDAFLSELVIYRNKGLGHQAEETWFPRNPHMYALLVSYLAPALDDLLSWEPMRDLLIRYEIVETGAEAVVSGGRRACETTRTNIAEGFAPLGPSFLLLGNNQRAEGRYVGRRTGAPRELQAIVRHVHFPQTLQTSDHLYRQYARRYLMTYLERGLITKPQRQGELDSLWRRLSIPDLERQRIESEIQQAINDYTPDDAAQGDASLQRLATLLSHEWIPVQTQAPSLLAQLPRRRKAHILDQIDNNVIMSFDQLRAESELSEPDLDSVLADLEQEGRVRRVGGSLDRAHAHFKAQDPKKPASFRALLDELRVRAHKSRKYPGSVWKLVELCESLLADDGIALSEGEVIGYRGLFDGFAPDGAYFVPEEDGGVMLLRVGDDDIRATSVRDLFEKLAELLRRRGVVVTGAVPHLIGRTRFLVNFEPQHANGTAFAVPVNVGELYFEANRNRDQALTETLAFLHRLGLTASSPDIEGRREVDEEEGVGLDDNEASSSMLGIEIRSDPADAPSIIRGTTVSKFFTALLDHLLDLGAPLEKKLPVRAGRIRYLLADEPYHANARRFDTYIERDGYFMNTSFSYEQAMAHARMLCEELGLQATPLGGAADEPQDVSVPLRIEIDGQTFHADDVPTFLFEVVTALYEKGILSDADIPYKSGRVRYFIAESPIHDHGRAFNRPLEVYLGDHRYYIEANISRQGALELVQRLVARKSRTSNVDSGASRAGADDRA